jgi:hypothetical protein
LEKYLVAKFREFRRESTCGELCDELDIIGKFHVLGKKAIIRKMTAKPKDSYGSFGDPIQSLIKIHGTPGCHTS